MDRVIQLTAHCSDWWGRHWRSKSPQSIHVEAVALDNFPNAPAVAYVHECGTPEMAARLLRAMADEIERRPRLFNAAPVAAASEGDPL